MPSTSVPPPAAEAVDALPRQRIADPDFWLAVVAWTVIGWSFIQILLFSFGRDQSIYAVVADGILEGKMPYRDVWDFKPPGIFLVYALAEKALGRSMVAPRLLEVVGLLGMAFAFRRLAKTFFGIRRVGLLGAALAILLHAELEFWHTGQPESFGGMLTVFALVCTAVEGPVKRRYFWWAAMGALFGCAFLLKPPLGGGAIVCAAYLARREVAERGKLSAALAPFLVAGAASLVPLLVCGLWFELRGSWDALSWTMFHFTPGYTKLSWVGRSAPEMFYWALEEAFFRFSALLAFGAVAAIAIRPMHTREREGLFLLSGVISVHLAGIAMQGKFFQYHYGATLPLIGLIAGLGFYKLWRRCLMQGPVAIVAFVAFVGVAASMRTAVRDLGSSFWERSVLRTRYILNMTPFSSREILDRELYAVADFNLDGDRQAALTVQSATTSDDSIFVWGFEPAIYWLSGRRPASRFIYNVAQRAQWERGYARQQLMQELKRDVPAAIIVQHNDVFPVVTGDHKDSLRALPAFPELDRFISERYEFRQRVEDFDLYYLRQPGKPPAGG